MFFEIEGLLLCITRHVRRRHGVSHAIAIIYCNASIVIVFRWWRVQIAALRATRLSVQDVINCVSVTTACAACRLDVSTATRASCVKLARKRLPIRTSVAQATASSLNATFRQTTQTRHSRHLWSATPMWYDSRLGLVSNKRGSLPRRRCRKICVDEAKLYAGGRPFAKSSAIAEMKNLRPFCWHVDHQRYSGGS